MENIEKKNKIKIFTLFEYIFWTALGIFVGTQIAVGNVGGSVIGAIVHLFFKIAVTSLMIIVTKKTKLSFVVYNTLEFIFGTINFLKINARSQPFEPWDLSLFEDFDEIATFLELKPSDFASLFLMLVLFAAITFLDIYAFEKCCKIPDKKGKIAIACIAIPILIFLCTSYMRINVNYIEANKNGFSNFAHFGRTNEYGAMVNFFLDIGMIGWENIDVQYSEEGIKEIYDRNVESVLGKEEYDNVIIVLLESYYDVNKLDVFSFKENPLKNYYNYLGEKSNTELCVQNIGGGTSNVEYQVLTMHGIEQYNNGIYPYIHLIKNEIESLPRVFKDNGYQTTAIHNYKGSFYNRDDAYELMGIDTFITDEDFDCEPESDTEFIDDVEVYNKITEIIEKQEKSFITVTTMGGHQPYIGYTFKEYTEWIENEKWDKTLTLSINNYIQKIRNTDDMLGDLIEYTNNTNEKTLIIAYGDHFPAQYEILNEEGLIERNDNNLTPEKYPELFELPYIVYSNVQDDIEVKEKITPSEIGMYILENVKLDNISVLYKGIYNYFKGNETFESYQLMQYDNIQGEQYWRNYKK